MQMGNSVKSNCWHGRLVMAMVAVCSFCAIAAHAQGAGGATDRIMQAAEQSFDRMPNLRIVREIKGNCGADDDVNEQVAYCTSQNTIFLTSTAAELPQAPHLVAHTLGHAIQVRHGIADFALAQIRARSGEESYLRGLVTRQVACLAGMLFARAGLPEAQLTDWYQEEPFTHSHWGRDPLSIGPRVSIGLAERDTWFQTGQGLASPEGCAVGELPSDPLVEAFKG